LGKPIISTSSVKILTWRSSKAYCRFIRNELLFPLRYLTIEEVFSLKKRIRKNQPFFEGKEIIGLRTALIIPKLGMLTHMNILFFDDDLIAGTQDELHFFYEKYSFLRVLR
jgi:hypothetical protein